MMRHDVSKIKKYQHELSGLCEAVQKAGALIQTMRARGFDIHHKDQAQTNPVTEADEAANALLVETLHERYPDDLVVSEECPISIGVQDSQRVWYIDPIDGTKEFIKGIDEWSIMIGMAIKGQPVLGVVYQPDQDKLYYASKGEGAYVSVNGHVQAMSVRRVHSLNEVILVESRSHASQNVEAFIQQRGIQHRIPQGSLGLKLALIAEGKADIYLNFSGHTHLWDVCAPEIILREAGGVLQAFNGKPISYQPHCTQVGHYYLAVTPSVWALDPLRH